MTGGLAGPPDTTRKTFARVMVCDDSAVMRAAIARALEGDPAVRVVARAANGAEAIEELRRRAASEPIDVVVLDIEMPEMNGLAALPLLLRAAPGLRIIMASTLTTRGAGVTLRALSLGAADYIAKPSALAARSGEAFRTELLAKVKALAGRRPIGQAPISARPVPLLPARLLAVGSSTGGPPALLALMAGLGARLTVPVVVTQHMPAAFTPTLAEHMSRAGKLPCAEARDGESLCPARVYLAPGNRHLCIERAADGLRARLSSAPEVNHCRPSVDPMLASAAVACDGRVLVAMLSGMGHDGLEGTRAVIAAGGAAIAQDAASSVVWGMPGAIARAGLCHAVLPLADLAPSLLALLQGRP